MKQKIAMTLIVAAGSDKDAKAFARCLGSFNGYVDGIFIQLNAPKGKPIHPRMRQIAEQFTDNVYTHVWKNNFVEARNAIFKKVPKKYDWVGWVDVDDRIDNPENIIPVLAVMPEDVQGIYILYDYQKDEFGNVVVAHWTTRVVRNNGSFAWKSSIDDDEVAVHETLIAKRTVTSVSNNEWKVVHEAGPEHYKESLIRNISLLEGMAQRQALKPEGVDPRILFYLGSHYNEAYRFNEALELFIEYLKVSGWAEERAEAHVFIGRILANKGNTTQARTAFLMAMGENPDNTGAYLELAKLEAKAKRWEQSAGWAKRGIEIKPKISPMVQYNNEYELLALYAQALSNLGGKSLTEALKIAQRALKLRPFDPDAKNNRDNIENLVEYRNNLRATARLIHELKKSESDKILPLLDCLPENLQDSPVVINTRQELTPPKKWPKKSIALYVGHGPLGTWGPWSVNEGGVGGSEEAVVRLSRELARLGWCVEIFGTPGTQVGGDGDYNIGWRHYWEFNYMDSFDVLISWRQPALFDHKFKARKKYLWLHDVMPAEELTPERIKNVTKVIYVSKYHSQRPENQHIPAAKRFASGNGITPEDFIKYDGQFKRDPSRCIYMSANERGLRILYDIWPDVKRAVPGATLDHYYGWQSFDAVNRDNPERMAWKASMQLKLKKLKGVTDHGRIGQDELNKEIFKSGLFTYPCFFPEVNCITAQKAMAGGAVPITSDFAALKDIIEFGEQIPMNKFEAEDIERYKQRLIWWLQHPEEQEKVRGPMMAWARSKFDWKNTSINWDKDMS